MKNGIKALLSAAMVAGLCGLAFAGDGKTDAKDADMKSGEPSCCSTATAAAGTCSDGKTETVSLKDNAAKQQFEALKSLAGKWVHESKDLGKGYNEFKVTAGGSVVMETMMPGTDYEMVNCYHMDGDNLMVTHYCAQGVQPRMKLVSVDGKTMKFDFLDCTNLPSKDAPHMHDLSVTIDGDKVTEKWGYFKDGKVEDHVDMEMTREKQTS